jgi:diaminopimelate decarboxylase
MSFGRSRPRIIIERYMVGGARLRRAQASPVAQRSRRATHRCREEGPREPAFPAGPTCDRTDVIDERTDYELPNDPAPGDFVDVLSAGADAASHASVEFNDFAPIQTYCL